MYHTAPPLVGSGFEPSPLGRSYFIGNLPDEPTGDCIWNIELATFEFPDEFLEALLAVKNEMAASGQSAEFVVYGKREAPASGEGEGEGGAPVLHLSSDHFRDVNSVEDLRSLISEN